MPPSKVCPTEHQETAAVIQWWSFSCRKYGKPAAALIHCPNEGHRSPITAARLKAEGMRPGTPDLFLAVPVGSKHGLWIEMKRSRQSRVSDSQWEMLYMLDSLGYAALVAHGSVEAIDAIREYMRGEA